MISIILSTFNRDHFIEETLRSIQNQSYRNWECLIIDDGSIDQTEKKVLQYLEDNRFKYFKRSERYSKGLCGCRNMGLDLVSGEFVIFFDDDDIVHPRNLEICLKIIQKNSMNFCHYKKKPFMGQWSLKFQNIPLEPDISTIGLEQLEDIIMNRISFASCCILWRKKCFDEIRFNENLMYAEEWECYSRILTSGFQGVSIDQVLYYNRKHPDSNTGEFYNNDPVRRNSYSCAVKLVLDNLRRNDLLSAELKQYFLRIGFFFKDYSIIKYTLAAFDSSKIEKSKYKLGYIFYPLLKRYFILAKGLRNRTGR